MVMAVAKIRPMNRFFLVISRQYTVTAAAENVKAGKVAAPSGRLKSELEPPEKPESVAWMRDPATGNWVPENHFGETCVAELREKLLSKNRNLC